MRLSPLALSWLALACSPSAPPGSVAVVPPGSVAVAPPGSVAVVPPGSVTVVPPGMSAPEVAAPASAPPASVGAPEVVSSQALDPQVVAAAFPPEPPDLATFGGVPAGQGRPWGDPVASGLPPQAAIARWVARWQPRGYTLVSQLGEGSVRTAALRHSSGAVVALVVRGNEKVTFTVTPHPVTPLAVTGRCRVPVLRDLIFTIHSSAVSHEGQFVTGESRQRWGAIVVDLDGDGVLDLLSPQDPAAASCPDDLSFVVGFTRGNCVHEAGVVGPGSISVVDPETPLAAGQAHALDAERNHATVDRQGGVPDMTRDSRRFTLQGGRYRQLTHAHSTGRCHHCSVRQCRVEP